MVQAVKITSLNDIGTSIMFTTLVPVVNMTGTPTTEKANLQIVGNLILSEAGGSYFPPAAQAIVSQFVAYAAQPNITSVGTLNYLDVLGNINAGNANLGNLAIANVFSGSLNGSAVSANTANTANTVTLNAQPNITSLGTLTSLNVTGLANLGDVTDITITGGNPNYVLQTDGNGTLSWAAQTGGSGNANTGNITFTNANISTDLLNTDIQIIGNGTGDVNVVANNKVWTFNADGNLTTPGNIIVDVAGDAIIESSSNVDVSAGGNTWTFGSDGNLTTPGNIIIDAVGDAIIESSSNVNVSAGGNTWTFGADGNLTLPNNTFAVNYANGTQVSIGGNVPIANDSTPGIMALGNGFVLNSNNQVSTSNLYNTNLTQPTQHYTLNLDTNGVVHLPDQSIINGSTLRGAPGTSALNYTGITIGPDSGNPENTWMWVDASNAYIATNYGANAHTWTFSSDGNLTIPGNIIVDVVGDAIIESSSNVDVSAGNNTWTFGANGNLTTPGNIIIDVVGDAIIESSSNVNVSAGGNTWTFGADGNLTIPGNIIVDVVGDAIIESSSNVNVSAGGNTWTFGADGNLTLPATTAINTEVSVILQANDTGNLTGLELIGDSNANLYAHNNVIIYTDSNGTGNTWVFGSDGNLTFPNGTTIDDKQGNLTKGPALNSFGSNSYTGTFNTLDFTDLNLNWVVNGPGVVNGVIQAVNATDKYVILDRNSGGPQFQNGQSYTFTGPLVSIGTDITVNSNSWTFGADGNLTLPSNTFAVNYANGTQVSIGGGGANTGNVTFSDINIIGDGNLKLQPDSANADAYLDIFLTAGPDIHIAGNGETVILGTDNFANVAVNVNGNVSIQAGDANGTHTWTFDTTGNLILAGGDSVIQSIANSSLDRNNANVSTMVFTPDQNYTSQSLVIDPTGPSHIHLRAPGANIDEPYANIFLGGEESSFEVGYYNSSAPNLFIHSNNNTWTFDTAGTLVFPRDTGPNTTDPILNIIGGANPTITSTDASLAGPANLGISALTTIFTGFTGDAIKIYPDDGEISSTANLQIWANSGGNTEYSWTFDTTGNLTLPLGSIVYETNIPGGALSGSAIALKPIGGTTANQQLLIYPTAADGDHIHLTSGNLYATELFLGSDNLYVKLANTGNVVINSNDGNSSNAMWTFDTDGNLTLPGNLVINGLTNVFGSNVALLQSNPDLPLLSVSSGSNGGVSSLWVEDIGNTGTSNIAAVYANPTPGSGIVRIAVGQNGGNGGPNLWDFDASGNLTLPTSGHIIVSGGIVGGGASPAPYISSFDSIGALEFTNGNSNVTVNSNSNLWTFDSTGNLTVPGSSGGFIKTIANASIGVAAVDNGTNNPAQLLSMTNAGVATSIVSAYATNATIQTNATGTINTWKFDNAGNLTLPANSFSINFANGSQAALSSIANGNSNVNIATANGNVTIAAVGNTTMTITGTGANVTGTLNVTGNITGNTNGFAIGYLNIPQVAASNTTIALSDAGKHYYSTSSGNFTLTIPNNATTTFATGTAISIVVQATGNVLVNAASGVTLYMAGNSTAANRVVSNYGMATLMKVNSDTWMISGTGVA